MPNIKSAIDTKNITCYVQDKVIHSQATLSEPLRNRDHIYATSLIEPASHSSRNKLALLLIDCPNDSALAAIVDTTTDNHSCHEFVQPRAIHKRCVYRPRQSHSPLIEEEDNMCRNAMIERKPPYNMITAPHRPRSSTTKYETVIYVAHQEFFHHYTPVQTVVYMIPGNVIPTDSILLVLMSAPQEVQVSDSTVALSPLHIDMTMPTETIFQSYTKKAPTIFYTSLTGQVDRTLLIICQSHYH